MSEAPPRSMREFELSLPMALMRAREAVMRRFRPILAEHGLSEQQWRVLRALQDVDVAMAAGELADATFLLGPSLSRMLATLESRGLVNRTVHPSDARRTEIVISRAGRDLVESIAPRSEVQYEAIGDHLAPGELDELYRLLALVGELD